jgi:16S rRNA (uracil1498-N3)-methyltransferase
MKAADHVLFFVSPKDVHGSEINIAGGEFHHLKHVLRKKINDIVVCTDGRGSCYHVKLTQCSKSALSGKIVHRIRHERELHTIFDCAFVPLKGLRNDYIIEKGTELGVSRFLPFISERSVVKKVSPVKLRRYNNIAKSAMLQSRQYYMPNFCVLDDVQKLIARFKEYDCIVCAHESGKQKLQTCAARMLFIVGPEGGFSAGEMRAFARNKVHLVSLGSHRLRSETAVVCGLAKLMTVFNRL